MKVPEKIKQSIVKMTVENLKVTEEQAEKRVDALIKSGVLDKFDSPMDKLFQYTVDVAMQIPQK